MAKSIKGRDVNFHDLKTKNPNLTAIGNVRMNARGDQLGKNGKVVKTREQLAQEYHKKVENPVKNVPIAKAVAPRAKTEVTKPITNDTKIDVDTTKSPKK